MNARRKRTFVTAAVVGLVAGAASAAVLLWPDAAGAAVSVEQVDLSPLDRVPADAWQRLATKRIFFGHKSVGADVVAGLQDIAQRKPGVTLAITSGTELPGEPGFGHTEIGENHDPASKLAAYSAAIDTGPAPDIALLKFCFLDISAMAPAELFAAYKAAVGGLKSRHPQTTFVHVTMPLTRVATGPKARVKGLIGADVHGHADNRARAEYNRLMRAEYAGKEPLFDIARAESTLPDGRRATFGGGNECMAAGYTRDGGHLSESGRLAAARDLLLVLAEAAK